MTISTIRPTTRPSTKKVNYDDSIDLVQKLHALGSEDQTEVQDSLFDLYTLLSAGENNHKERQMFTHLGGHLAIVMALKKWYKLHPIQDEGLKVLSVACVEDEEAIITFRVGAIEIVLTAMQNFYDDEAIQEKGLIILYSVSRIENFGHYLVKKFNGLDVVVAAMKNNPSHLGVQMAACGLLCNCCTETDIKKDLKAAGVIQLMGGAIHLCTSDSENEQLIRGFAIQVLNSCIY